MAKTYSFYGTALTWASGKNMVSIWNEATTGRTLRIYRVWLLNSQSGAVTGPNAVPLTMARFTNGPHNGGTPLTTVYPHDTASSGTIPQGLTFRTTGTTTMFTGTEPFRTALRATDEATISAGITLDELNTFVPLNVLWDSGVGDNNVEPIVIRQNEGFVIQAGTTGSFVGQCDIFIEMTIT